MIVFYINIGGAWQLLEITFVMSLIEDQKILDESGEEWIGTSSMFINSFHRLYTKDQDDELHGIEARLYIEDDDLLDQIEITDEKIKNINR